VQTEKIAGRDMRQSMPSQIDDWIEQVQGQYTVRRDRGNAKKTVRGLLWCGGAVNAFVDRDKNAALNILRCATSKKRPRVLTRVQGAPALKPVITRWIT
jgi:hypothetical protein